MTKQELTWFDALHNDRAKVAEVLLRPEFINVFNEAIDKYSESAHFLYELFQNADDAGATKAELILEKDKLIFKHNGNVRFSVSDPNISAEEARLKGEYGHINSITAIGFSTKNKNTGEGNKIGKFGVGFKAIFQYTDSPYIYDYNIDFRLDKVIVPTLLTDKKYSEKGKTVFVLPFNSSKVSAEKSYKDIFSKIKSLEHPTLFLNNLKRISWKVSNENGVFECKTSESYLFDDIRSEKIAVTDGDKKASLWLFTRTITITDDGNKSTHNISVGLFLDKGKINTRVRPKIHCFFKTNDSLNTCFIVHAPFALANNREQLKKDNKTNFSLIQSLCTLMSDALVCLREITNKTGVVLLNDNIIDIISVKESTDSNHWSYPYSENCLDCSDVIKYSFINKIKSTALLLCREGIYVKCEYALWAPNDLPNLLSPKQLNYLIGYKDYYSYDKEVFEDKDETESFWERYSEDDPRFKFHFVLTSRNTKDERIITDILSSPFQIYNYEEFGGNITNEFMKAQSDRWLESFYQFVIKNRLTEIYQQNIRQMSSGVMRGRPIIKLDDGNFTAPFSNGNLNVFYKSSGVSYEANYVNEDLLKNSPSFSSLLKSLNVSIPNRLDYILTKLLPRYKWLSYGKPGQLSQSPDLIQDFEDIYLCWNNSSKDETNKLLEHVNKSFGMLATDGNVYQIRYLMRPDDLVSDYQHIACSEKITILDFDYYEPIIRKYKKESIEEFLDSLNFQSSPALYECQKYVTQEEAKKTYLPKDNSTSSEYGFNSGTLKYKSIIGIENYLLQGKKNNSFTKELSHYVWNLLYQSAAELFNEDAYISYRPYGDGRYNPRRIKCNNPLLKILLNTPWIYDSKKDTYVRIRELFLEDFIDNGYTVNEILRGVFRIDSSPMVKDLEQIKCMSKETQEIFFMGEAALAIFKTKEAMAHANQLYQQDKEKQAKLGRIKAEREPDTVLEVQKKKQRKFKQSDFADAGNRSIGSTVENAQRPSSKRKNLEETLAGFDEQAQTTRAELEEIETLRNTIEQSKRYSYIWFKTLIELESRSNGSMDSNSGKKTIFLKFEEVSIDKRNDNIIILKGCSRYIPTSIEDIDGISVTFFFRTGLSQAVEFEAASVKDNTVRLKVSNYKLDMLNAIKKNLNLISRAEINVDKPVALIEKWKSAIDSLGFDNNFCLRGGLRNDLKFIFGPPGTGKTTELARFISECIESNEKCRILVLAPTNKACDVITWKLLDRNPDNDYWIWRFVATMDSELDKEEVVYPRDSDIMSQNKVCVISTMARLSFDGFNDWKLSEIDWDYIIIDEASMIPLYQIVYPLYNNTKSTIIIAGDPFQIEPIVKIDEWANENIYSMVQLNDFKNPLTVPCQFEIQKLCTQYRSIPNVGQIYSKFAYGGVLEHFREPNTQKKIDFGFPCKSLNIINFPVDKNSSLYEPKRLMMSNIHIYSVLFVVELVHYITQKQLETGMDTKVSIGIISPYGAEIGAIDKLCQQKIKDISPNIELYFGTAHGFQGDECDVIIVVMNPPASGIKLAKNKVFINKTNILNVAISRARDYVFLLMPNTDYQFFSNMDAARMVGKLMFETGDCLSYSCDALESVIFGQSSYIEGNTFITSHQATNVYSDCIEKYEVRIDENSIDIQMKD